MNSTTWTGVSLALLGIGSLVATGAASALIPAIFGLALLGLGAAMQRPERAEAAGALALGAALLGVLIAVNTFGRLLSEGGLVLSDAIIATAATTVICVLYLALRIWERGGRGQNNTAR